MTVLRIGDASNYHRTLATGLRRLGCDVTVASSGGGFMQTERDIDLRRRLPGKLGGLDLWMRLNGPLRHRLEGYDVVSINGPGFVELRPERTRKIFNRLRESNGALFMTALEDDLAYVEECIDPSSRLRYNEFRQCGGPGPLALARPTLIGEWTSGLLREWCEAIYENIDGAVAALYEYYLSMRRVLPAEKVAYGGIPIDTAPIAPVEIPAEPRPVRIFLGRHAHRMAVKGTDRFEAAIRRALELNPGKGELIIVENRPYAEYLQLLRSAHIVVDQAYSYTPATNALLAMTYGIPVVSGGEPDFYDFIGQPATPGIIPSTIGPDGTGFTPGDFDPLRPVFNTPIDTDGMTDLFCHILRNPGLLRPAGIASRDFVLRHNTCEAVARRFLTHWQTIPPKKSRINSPSTRRDARLERPPQPPENKS